jgi:hypothetical protein
MEAAASSPAAPHFIPLTEPFVCIPSFLSSFLPFFLLSIHSFYFFSFHPIFKQ